MRGAGSWAVVTGATDGIGREFAMQLAKQGFNIVAVSRTPEKLVLVCKEIEAALPGTKTCHYAMDFSRAGPVEYEGLTRLISHLDVAVLVNNVGLSHAMPVNFLEMDANEMAQICEVNIMATQYVTRIVGPGLVKRYVMALTQWPWPDPEPWLVLGPVGHAAPGDVRGQQGLPHLVDEGAG